MQSVNLCKSAKDIWRYFLNLKCYVENKGTRNVIWINTLGTINLWTKFHGQLCHPQKPAASHRTFYNQLTFICGICIVPVNLSILPLLQSQP